MNSNRSRAQSKKFVPHTHGMINKKILQNMGQLLRQSAEYAASQNDYNRCAKCMVMYRVGTLMRLSMAISFKEKYKFITNAKGEQRCPLIEKGAEAARLSIWIASCTWDQLV